LASSPHSSLWRSVEKKLSSLSRTKLMECAALVILMRADVGIVSVFESQDSKKCSLRLSTSRSSSKSLEITTGRTLRLCGDTGVITKLPLPGIMMGPPQLNEYAVDPVGVATIIPSAQ